MGIHCILLNGATLTPAQSDALRLAAYQMRRRQQKTHKIRTPDMEGVIRTKHEMRTFIAVTGMFFEAHVSTSRGDSDVSFLLGPGEYGPDENLWEECSVGEFLSRMLAELFAEMSVQDDGYGPN